MADPEILHLQQHAAQVWALYEQGLKKSHALSRVIRFLGHPDALRGVVRVDAGGLGLGGNEATQRKKFTRFIKGNHKNRGWVLYEEKTRKALDKSYLKKKSVPILNPLTTRALEKRYGAANARRVPTLQYFMHPWQFAAAFMSLHSKDAEKLAQVALASASLMRTLAKLPKGKRHLGKVKKVSQSESLS